MRPFAACAFAMLACIACKPAVSDNAKNSPSTLKIVSSLVRTGSASAQTTNIVNGIRMALAERDGKAGAWSVTYEDWDDASAKKGDWDPEVEAANAERAIDDPRVMIYIGPYNSGAAKISAPALNRAGLANISPACTYPGLTKPGLGEVNEPQVYRPSGRVTFFRVVPSDDIQGDVAARWMKSMGARTVYVLDDLQLYGKGVADVFSNVAEDLGLYVIGRESIDSKAQEYRSLMAKVKQSAPDWIYFGGTTQSNAGQLVKDMVAEGLQSKMMMPDGCFEDAMVAAAGTENANGRVFLTFGGTPPSEMRGAGASFVRNFFGKYRRSPDVYAVYGYVAMQAALDAIAVGGNDRTRVREALANTRQENGALGTWRFDANGDTTLHVMSGNVVENGKFKFVKLLGNDDKTMTIRSAAP
jgi:branched-chain amino acid transport system substrate-binding protein